MATQQRSDTSPAAALILVAVIALILSVAFGPTGFVIGVALFALAFVGAKRMATVRPTPVPARVRRLSTAGRLAVVGESRYQQALREMASDAETLATAVLVPEPASRQVRVDLLRGDGTGVTVGHLMKDDARRYQRALLELLGRGEVGSCPARITGGGRRFYGVHLHLGGPQLLQLDHETLGDAPTMPADQPVTVEETHQGVLGRILHNRPTANVIAELRDCLITKGIHEGAATLEVLLDGERAGQLTYAMGKRYADVVRAWRERTGRTLCEAVVFAEGSRGLQVTLLLPK